MAPIGRPVIVPSSASAFSTSVSMSSPLATSITVAPLWLIVTASLTHHALHSRPWSPVAHSVAAAIALTLLLITAVHHPPSPPASSHVPIHAAARLVTSGTAPHRGRAHPSSSITLALPFTTTRQGGPALSPLPSTSPPTTTTTTTTAGDGASPTPTPEGAATPSPAAGTPAPGTVPPSTTTSLTPTAPTSTLRVIPSRDSCAGGITRMQAVLLLELFFEFLFLFLRCFADAQLIDGPDDDDPAVDVTMRGYVFMRTIYTVPVILLNCGIYWVGGGPTGACLTSYSEVQVPFAHLIFYLLYCMFIVVIGVYRIDSFERAADSGYYDTASSAGYNGYNGSAGPPTRTTSYFRYYSRRRRGGRADGSGYQVPKFRVNLGCCAINF